MPSLVLQVSQPQNLRKYNSLFHALAPHLPSAHYTHTTSGEKKRLPTPRTPLKHTHTHTTFFFVIAPFHLSVLAAIGLFFIGLLVVHDSGAGLYSQMLPPTPAEPYNWHLFERLIKACLTILLQVHSLQDSLCVTCGLWFDTTNNASKRRYSVSSSIKSAPFCAGQSFGLVAGWEMLPCPPPSATQYMYTDCLALHYPVSVLFMWAGCRLDLHFFDREARFL